MFVSLSADKPADTQKWKDMVKEFGMKGICGIAPGCIQSRILREV